MLNIVMPIAGAGQRFKDAWYATPKPLIKIYGQPMCDVVRENIAPRNRDHRLIVISPAGLMDNVTRRDGHPFADYVINLHYVTDGAARTVLLAQNYLDTYDPLLIVNGDQYIEGLDIDAFLDYAKDFHGAIMTFDVGPDEPPKWSYVRRERGSSSRFPLKTRANNSVIQVAEKEAISREATCGIYWFRHGWDFLRAANAMITRGARTNNEFYLCPVYNEMLAEGLKVGAWNVGEHAATMHGLGTPEDLEKFIAHCGATQWADANMG